MGKGNGDDPPQKFIDDQRFCQFCIFMFIGTSITLSGLSAGMDNGGSFPFPYFITGFVLAVILLVNLISRRCVVEAVQKKGVTRRNIVDTLSNTNWGKHAWPWSCRVGMLWCIAGSILTGLGGINCYKGGNDDVDPDSDNSTGRNNCYYDIEGENGDLYKGLAIPLVVIHGLSFVYLLLSHCPAESVMEKIKEDPRGNTVTPVNNSAPATAPSAPPAVAPSGAPAASTSQTSAASGRGNGMEVKTTIQKLESRVKELENREREIGDLNLIPPPPSYNETVHTSSYRGVGAHPDNSFP